MFDFLRHAGLGLGISFPKSVSTEKTWYGFDPTQLPAAVISPHNSAGFVFTDTICIKCFCYLDGNVTIPNPLNKSGPCVKFARPKTDAIDLSNDAMTLKYLIKRGAHFAACIKAASNLAWEIAEPAHGERAVVPEEFEPTSCRVPAQFQPGSLL